MTTSDQPLAALCNVSPAEIKIDFDELFRSTSIGRYVRLQQATWRNLQLCRLEHVQQTAIEEAPEGHTKGSVSIDGSPAEETYFTLRDAPSSAVYGNIIVLDCFLGDQGEQYFVVITKINPYSCRDYKDNIVLPYVASVYPRALADQHPLGDDGIARQMIVNRHYGIC